MKDRKLTDRELETLAKAVVIAGENAVDIEGLASGRKLFHGVLLKIAAECENRPRSSRIAWKPAAAFAAAAVIVTASFVLYINRSTHAPRSSSIPDTNFEIKKPVQVYEADKPMHVPDKPEAVKTVLKKQPSLSQPAKPRRTVQVPVKDTEAIFHPIGLVETAEDAAIDGRVVRVEMPRSALFALGVDLPLENGTRTVRADLLVGADGSPRAIRLVE